MQSTINHALMDRQRQARLERMPVSSTNAIRSKHREFVGNVKARILRYLHESTSGMTADECMVDWENEFGANSSIGNVVPQALCSLRQSNDVYLDGTKRPTRLGRQAGVYRIASK